MLTVDQFSQNANAYHQALDVIDLPWGKQLQQDVRRIGLITSFQLAVEPAHLGLKTYHTCQDCLGTKQFFSKVICKNKKT